MQTWREFLSSLCYLKTRDDDDGGSKNGVPQRWVIRTLAIGTVVSLRLGEYLGKPWSWPGTLKGKPTRIA